MEAQTKLEKETAKKEAKAEAKADAALKKKMASQVRIVPICSICDSLTYFSPSCPDNNQAN